MQKGKWKCVLALSAMLFTAATWAGNGDESPQGDGAFYAISVADLDTMIAWYEGKLGLALVSRGANEQRDGALLRGPGLLVELAEFRGARPRTALETGVESHEIHGIFKIGFLVEDVDRRFDQLEAAGVDIFFPVVTADDGLRTFGIRDPEGNIVQYFSR